jgi:hypothetical protein
MLPFLHICFACHWVYDHHQIIVDFMVLHQIQSLICYPYLMSPRGNMIGLVCNIWTLVVHWIPSFHSLNPIQHCAIDEAFTTNCKCCYNILNIKQWFFLTSLWHSQNDNHLWENLIKFGHKQDTKAKKLSVTFLFTAT